MALPTCNPWTSNTVRQSDQQAACLERSARAAQFEMLDMQFLFTVIDSLQRLNVAGVTGFEPLSAYNACDGEVNAHNANCAIGNTTLPFQANSAELKQMILWQLANPLCANNA